VTGAKAHLARFREVLTRQAEAVRESLAAGNTDEERTQGFVERLRREIRKALPEHEARATELAAPFDQLWQGLARYWSKNP
ncbi:MAG: hypothetical protein Q8N52_12820, partial [Acidobacteriota bacterium]|nr:hypothetical protein [Acidobacteriota bacterium]